MNASTGFTSAERASTKESKDFPTRNRRERSLAQKCGASSIAPLALLWDFLEDFIHEYVLLYLTHPKFPPVISSTASRPVSLKLQVFFFSKATASTYCLQYMSGCGAVYWSMRNFSQASSLNKADFLPSHRKLPRFASIRIGFC